MSRLEHETKPGKLPVYLNIGKYSIRVSRAPNAQVLGMSKREMEIVLLILSGLTIKEAALTMGISENTAQTYQQRVGIKLGVGSKVDLIGAILDHCMNTDKTMMSAAVGDCKNPETVPS